MRSIIYILLLLIYWGQYLCAQPPHSFTQYQTSDGLRQKIIMDILQDKKGLIWLATWDGIYKFDGNKFQNYKNEQDNKSGFNNSRIDNLFEDDNNYLWLLSYDKQVYRFDMTNNKFLSLPYPNYQAKKVVNTSNQYTWIITVDRKLIEVQNKYGRDSLKAYNFFLKNNLEERIVYSLFKDQDNNLWILSNEGLYWLEFTTERYIIHYIPTSVSFFDAIETSNNIYFGGDNGQIAVLNKRDKKIHIQKIDTNAGIRLIKVIAKGMLLLGTDIDGLVIYKPGEGIIKRFNTQNHSEIYSDFVQNIYIDKQQEAWIRFKNTLGVYHLSIGSQVSLDRLVLRDLYGKDIVNSRPEMYVSEDIYNNIWVHPAGGGLGYYDRKSDKLVPFYNPNRQSGWDSENKVTAIFSDRQGNLWLGSYNNGLEKVSFNINPFHLFRNNPSDHESLENYTRANFQDSKGRIWMGEKDKTVRVYDKGLEFKYLDKHGRISPQKDELGMAYCFAEDHKGNIWIGTKGNGIIVASPTDSPEKYELTFYKNNKEDITSINNNNIYSIHEDQFHRMWIATFGGGVNLCILNENVSGLTFYHTDNNLKMYPIGICDKVRFVTSDRYGTVWIGTTNGLLVVANSLKDPLQIAFNHYRYDSDNPFSIKSDNIHEIFFSRKNSDTYLATFGGGLNKVIKDNGRLRFKAYTIKNRLPSNVILSLEEDSLGNLWMCTEEELCRFNPYTEEVITYSSKELPTYLKFNEGSALHTRNGYLMFNTFKGALYFKPDSIKSSKYIPPIVFTEFAAGDDWENAPNRPLKNIDYIQKIELRHDQNQFVVQFMALDMKNPSNITYAYKLENFEKKWNYTNQEHSAKYTNLPKGKYRFMIKSTNSDGIWVDNTRTIDIVILPSFWETSIAYTLYVLVFFISIGVVSYIMFVIYRLKHNVSIEKEISDIKLRFFTDISHELRTPLTLIIGPVEQLIQKESVNDEKYEQLIIIQRNANRLLRLVNQILDFRKIQNKKMKMQVSQIELVSFITDIMRNFEYLAEKYDIGFTFYAEKDSLNIWADADKLEKIIFNLLSNAFKYTPRGKRIRVKIEENVSEVFISISDEGIGMNEDQMNRLFGRFETFANRKGSSGIGLSLTKELVEMHKGSIKVESTLYKGSTFTVSLLKGDKHFDPGTEFILSDCPDIKTILPQPADFIPAKSMEEQSQNFKYTILLVEDNDELRYFVRSIFIDSFNILEAEDGDTGFELAYTKIPDIIISDIMMPNKNGIELLKDLRTNEHTSHILVVLLSAKTSIDNKLEGLEYGADDYITKPFSAIYLKARVLNLIERREQLQELYCKSLFPSQLERDTLEKQGSPRLSVSDQKFMDNLIQIITEKMDDSDLTIDDIAVSLHISRSVFFRRLKSITGQSPVDFLKHMRLKRAVQLIETHEYSIAEIAYNVGFSDAHYFSKCFKQIYGKTPTEYKEGISSVS